MVDIEGTSALANFEVIEIMDDNNPNSALLGMDWATDMNGVTNLKKQKIFEKKSLHVVVPLDPVEGYFYIELVHNYEIDDDFHQIYKLTT